MFQNYLVVTVRNFLRQRLYSWINVGGLSAGLVCVVMIYLWVKDEVSKDKFHNDIDHIYLVISNLDLGTGETLTWDITPGPLAEDIRENIPGVELAARTMTTGGILFQYDDKNLIEHGLYADPEFLSVFSFKIISGVPDPIGINKNSIAISNKLAANLFGDQDPIGKIVRVNRQYDCEVKAVLDDIGTNSSIKFEFLLPFEIYKQNRGDGFNWSNYDHPLYLKLIEPGKRDEVLDLMNQRRASLSESNNDVKFYLQPFADRYLYSQFENGVPVGGRIKFTRLFSVVAAFILLIACINFMNMATAKAATRAKEVGVRKVVGAQRHSLITQFMMESLVISLLSMILALSVVYLTLPAFNTLISKNIDVNFFDAGFLFVAGIIVLITGSLAGSYPAFYLSAFSPSSVLKSTMGSTFRGASLRKVLVIFQFTLTVILGASAIVVYLQIQFVRNKNIGYNRNGVLTFPIRGPLANQFEAYRSEASQHPAIQLVSRADNSLVQVNNQNGSVDWPGKPENSAIFFRTVCVDYDFLETMDLKLLDGRFFSRAFADTSNMVITRRAAEIMGFSNPIGQRISQWGTEGTIVGVVDDFHSRSLQSAIDPIVFFHRPQWTWRVFVRFDGAQTASVVERLTEIHKKYNPDYPFEFTFLDDDFENLYNNEKVISSLAIIFTMMTIIISGLGLLGLAAYTAERRKKEVSIRKILGASVLTIVTMMSREFVKLSLVACVIGCPLAFYLMSKFLESYAYHTELTWSIFVMTGLSTVVLAVLTVIFQVTKAAMLNPAETLRTE